MKLIAMTAMIKPLDTLRRKAAILRFFDTTNGGASEWSRLLSFFTLLGAFFFIRLGEEEMSGFIVVVATASLIFIVQDIKTYRREINCVANFGSVFLFVALLSVCQWLAIHELPEMLGAATNWYRQYGVVLAISCIGAAIVEEIVFRRYLHEQLRRFLTVNWAILLSAVVFMFAHGFFSLHLLMVGIACGILSNHLGSIHAAMLIHAISNFFGAATSHLDGAVNEHGLSHAAALGGGAAMAEIFAILWLFTYMGARAIYHRCRQ
jgi:membrane protease YdiL (CAAX protease family)